jgi:hypothetical protein
MTLIWRKETIETDVVCGFVCNMCGLVVQPGVGVATVEELASRLTGLVGAVVHAGYGAEHLTDGVTYSFSICEKCLSDMFTNQFRVPVTVKDVNDVMNVFDDLGDNTELAAMAITFTAQEVAAWHTRDDGTPYDDGAPDDENCNVSSPTMPTPEEVEDTLGPACSPEETTRRQALATELIALVALPVCERPGEIARDRGDGMCKYCPRAVEDH